MKQICLNLFPEKTRYSSNNVLKYTPVHLPTFDDSN